MIFLIGVTLSGLWAYGRAPLLALLLVPAAISRAQWNTPQVEAARPVPFRSVSITNDAARRDVNGEIIDAHDGCLQFFDDRYYLYGTAYGKSAGFGINNRFRVYSSPDLERWQFEGELLKEPPRGVFYRPYVVYNSRTRKYVLWFNWYPQLWDGQLGVAVSDSPVGPFTIASLKVKLSQAAHPPHQTGLIAFLSEATVRCVPWAVRPRCGGGICQAVSGTV